uniref:TMEM205-like domain-containing protein n=1 Tax=Araucaria cunninghamii TaxID=56994 RepID=A0A0D6R7R0_ARACU
MAWLTRFVVMVSFLALGILFSPEAFGSKFGGQSEASAQIGGSLAVVLKLAHLLSFATAWGAALWVTFIGGIIMFKNLPRHQFGNLQGKMFPAYFSMVGMCGAICLAAFALVHPWSAASYMEKLQMGFLASSLVFTLSNLLIFTPLTMNMMRVRHKIEREENIGDEVGLTKNREVAKKNPKLAEINKKFGMIHGMSSLANLLSFGGLAMHSWYLASRLLL